MNLHFSGKMSQPWPCRRGWGNTLAVQARSCLSWEPPLPVKQISLNSNKIFYDYRHKQNASRKASALPAKVRVTIQLTLYVAVGKLLKPCTSATSSQGLYWELCRYPGIKGWLSHCQDTQELHCSNHKQLDPILTKNTSLSEMWRAEHWDKWN